MNRVQNGLIGLHRPHVSSIPVCGQFSKQTFGIVVADQGVESTAFVKPFPKTKGWVQPTSSVYSGLGGSAFLLENKFIIAIP